jgi:hypothetical protein
MNSRTSFLTGRIEAIPALGARYSCLEMRTQRDPDVLLVERMLAPPSVDDARGSLEYWQRRAKALPRYQRAARREARDMATRWEHRLEAAERARFEVSLLGRLFAAVGISNVWLARTRLTRGLVVGLVWRLVPRSVKLAAGAVAAAWLLVGAAIVAVAVQQLA